MANSTYSQPGSIFLKNSVFGWVAAVTLRLSIILDFVMRPYGAAYGVTKRDRAWLVRRFYNIVRTIPAGTTAVSHIIMAREILTIPPHIQGDVVECGVWQGASSASLSLVCAKVGRRLLVCDSFEGLPDEGVQLFMAPHSKTYGYLQGGMFCGSLVEVQRNIGRLGCLDVCHFVSGLFALSLPALHQPVAFAFLDVDLPTSFQDCLRTLWPLLIENGAIYVDDVGWMEVVRVFFDEAWWQQQLGCAAPGLIGSGCGLPISPYYANIGYVRKPAPFQAAQWQQDPDLAYSTESSL